MWYSSIDWNFHTQLSVVFNKGIKEHWCETIWRKSQVMNISQHENGTGRAATWKHMSIALYSCLHYGMFHNRFPCNLSGIILSPIKDVFCSSIFSVVKGFDILLCGGNSVTLWFVKTALNPIGWSEKFKVINLAHFLETRWNKHMGFYLTRPHPCVNNEPALSGIPGEHHLSPPLSFSVSLSSSSLHPRSSVSPGKV